MICVSIGRSRHKMVAKEHQVLADQGAELVELRLDWLSRLPKLSRLLTDRPTPVVITCRRKMDGGRWTGNEEQRLTLLRAAIAEGVEYVDLEEDIANQIPRYGPTKRIISYHSFNETPDLLGEIHARLSACDPDLVKLVTMAQSPRDMIRLLKLVQDSKVPTIGFCMGEFGLASRVLCAKYGAPFTYATFRKARELAPGQFSFDEMRDVYRFDAIDSETDVFGVLGDTAADEIAVRLQNAAFREKGMNAVCVPFRVRADELLETLDRFEWLGVRGYAVTAPHQAAVVACEAVSDEMVATLGVADTLFREEQAGWCASNADSYAVLQCLRSSCSSDSTHETFLAGQSVLVLGAGYMAHLVGSMVVRAGAELTIANRTRDRAIDLAARIGAKHVAWEDRELVEPDILVNSTPVGMEPHIEESPFAAAWMRKDMLVFDLVDKPSDTALLAQAREQQCRTISGLDVRVRRIARQFELWTSHPAPLDLFQKWVRPERSTGTFPNGKETQA